MMCGGKKNMHPLTISWMIFSTIYQTLGNSTPQVNVAKALWPRFPAEASCQSLLAATGCEYQDCSLCSDLRETRVSLETLNISTKVPARSSKVYMPIIVPPFFGSSALEYLLDTSPHTSSMCHLKTWQCESSWYLIRRKLVTKKTLWDSAATNWTQVYEHYHRDQVWDNPNATILLDKAPPNIVKVKQLVDFYESNGLDYKMIVMWRSPCRHDWLEDSYHSTNFTLQQILTNILKVVPKKHRILINYDDLLLRPANIMKKVLLQYPILESLHIRANGQVQTRSTPSILAIRHRRRQLASHARRRHRRNPGLDHAHMHELYSYVTSEHCKLSITGNQTTPEALGLWETFLQEARS
eukprot:m.521997 g.521997  ORF g.521997 m.521997 type:complete len:354 (-) comp21966_c0_seq7:1073-2134(-)